MVLWGSFDQLLSYVVLIMLVSSMATGLAHLTLRARRPALFRPYRTWGYPLTPLLFVGTYGWIAWQISWEKPQTSLLGLVIALSGLPFYFFWSRKLKRANTKNEEEKMRKREKMGLLLTLFFFWGTGLVWAEGKMPKEFETYTLGEIVVPGDKVRETTVIAEITAEDIPATNSKTVAEALSYAPGIR